MSRSPRRVLRACLTVSRATPKWAASHGWDGSLPPGGSCPVRIAARKIPAIWYETCWLLSGSSSGSARPDKAAGRAVNGVAGLVVSSTVVRVRTSAVRDGRGRAGTAAGRQSCPLPSPRPPGGPPCGAWCVTADRGGGELGGRAQSGVPVRGGDVGCRGRGGCGAGRVEPGEAGQQVRCGRGWLVVGVGVPAVGGDEAGCDELQAR